MSRRWGKPPSDSRDWPSYNERLVVRGEFFLDPTPFERWTEELVQMNQGKRGGQYRLPDSFVRWLVIWKQLLDYRSLEGLVRRFATLGIIPSTTSADYTTLWHRLHHRTPTAKLPKYADLELATDGSGLKTGNAGEYRIFRYGDPEAKRRKHLVVVITADVHRKKLIGIEVHIEGVGHSEAEVAQRHLRTAGGPGPPRSGVLRGRGVRHARDVSGAPRNGGGAGGQDCAERGDVAKTQSPQGRMAASEGGAGVSEARVSDVGRHEGVWDAVAGDRGNLLGGETQIRGEHGGSVDPRALGGGVSAVLGVRGAPGIWRGPLPEPPADVRVEGRMSGSDREIITIHSTQQGFRASYSKVVP